MSLRIEANIEMSMPDADPQGISPTITPAATSAITPTVGIIACRHESDRRMFQAVQEKYISAVNVGMDAIPLLIPCIGHRIIDSPLLDRLDGVLLTGSASNVHPHRYGARASRPATLHDSHRDESALPLIRRAVDAGVPLLAICRGFQEMNVAFGGSLIEQVHERSGSIRHHPDENASIEEQYAPSHRVSLTEKGFLHRLFGRREIEVNSLHYQGIDRLAPGLVVEAVAPDGLIEAVRVEGAKAFAVGVQWHPEWRLCVDPPAKTLFEAFAHATRQRGEARMNSDGLRPASGAAERASTGDPLGPPLGRHESPTSGS